MRNVKAYITLMKSAYIYWKGYAFYHCLTVLIMLMNSWSRWGS